MIKNFLILLLLLTNSCVLYAEETYDHPHELHTWQEYDICLERETYLESADYCYYFYDGVCCEWSTESWTGDEICYEEWCKWDDSCGWEHVDTYGCIYY